MKGFKCAMLSFFSSSDILISFNTLQISELVSWIQLVSCVNKTERNCENWKNRWNYRGKKDFHQKQVENVKSTVETIEIGKNFQNVEKCCTNDEKQ